MKVRFLRMTDSAQPGFPFVPGQVIEVATLTPEVREWLKPLDDGSYRAVVLDDEPEQAAAVIPTPEVAVMRPARRAPARRAR